MPTENCITGPGENLLKKPKIYIACAADEGKDAELLAQELLAVRDCRIYTGGSADSLAPTEDTRLILLPLRFPTLYSLPGPMQEAVRFAEENRIPLLPVLMEPGLEELFSRPHKFGELPFLRFYKKENSYLSFRDALTLALNSLLIPEALIDEALCLPQDAPPGGRRDLLQGIACLAGLNGAKDSDTGLRLLHKAANADVPEAAVYLLRAYSIGIDVPAEDRVAFYYSTQLLDHFSKLKTIPSWRQQLDFLVDVAFFYIRRDYQRDGVQAVRRLRNFSKNSLGIDHPLTVRYTDLLCHLCSIYWQDRDWILSLCKEQYWSSCYRLGDSHPESIQRLHNLAVAESACGEKIPALKSYTTAYKLCVTVYGEEAPETLKALHSIAFHCKEMEQLEHACKVCDTAYGLWLQTCGRDDPATLDTLRLLASIRLALGDHRDCTRLTRRLYAGRLNTFGANHPSTLLAQFQLAMAYKMQGSKKSALDHMSQVYEAYRNLYGSDYALTKHVALMIENLKKGDDES